MHFCQRPMPRSPTNLPFFGHQPAAQKDLLGPSLDFKSFKWFIVNAVKAVFVSDDSLPFRVEDYHISVSANAQISLVGQSHHFGRIGGKSSTNFLRVIFPVHTP